MTVHRPNAYKGRAVTLPDAATASGVVGDPHFNSVVLLMHFDGAYNSATFTHSGPTSRTLTVAGDSKQKHNTRFFGVGAGYFDGTGDEVTTDIHADFQLGGGDFTIEFAFCLQSFMNTNPHLFSVTDGSFANEIRFHTTNASQKLHFSIYHGGSYKVDIATTTTILVDKWYRAAAVRSGNSHYLFLDGALEASVSNAHTIPATAQNARLAVLAGAPYRAQCHLDELRMTKGVARYVSAYTPTSAPFPDSL